jgi:SAM-dependent methyltransferase
VRNEKQKFDGLSEDYDHFRPRYPAQLLQEIAKKVSVSAPNVVDAGAGTGIELEGLRPLLGPDAQYCAVDISTDMVAIGRMKFPSVSWFVEPVEPFLERATSVDLIIAAQSFQWMNRPRFLRAAAGCLNGSGVVAIIQNNRDFTASPFLDAYESVLEEFSPGYSRKYRDFDFAGELREYLAESGTTVEVATADWSTSLAIAEFVGMLKSSTQAQRAITAHGQVFLDRLSALLDEHAEGNMVTIPYRSELFTAQLPPSSESGAPRSEA